MERGACCTEVVYQSFDYEYMGEMRKRDLAGQTPEWEKTPVVDGKRQDATPPAVWLGIWEGNK